MERRTRRRVYFVLMGTCVLLIVLSWNVVRLWSTTVAVAMSVVAALLAPVAVIVANAGAVEESARRTDEASGQDD